MLENMLGLSPAGEDERPVKRAEADKWALNMEAARQFHAREGHLNVPRKHLEHIDGDFDLGRGNVCLSVCRAARARRPGSCRCSAAPYREQARHHSQHQPDRDEVQAKTFFGHCR